MPQAAAAEVFQHEDHLVVPVGIALIGAGTGAARLLKFGNAIGQLQAAAGTIAGLFEDAGSQEVGDVSQFVSGQALQKPAGPTALRAVGNRG
jgi:hypothetical protein